MIKFSVFINEGPTWSKKRFKTSIAYDITAQKGTLKTKNPQALELAKDDKFLEFLWTDFTSQVKRPTEDAYDSYSEHILKLAIENKLETE